MKDRTKIILALVFAFLVIGVLRILYPLFQEMLLSDYTRCVKEILVKEKVIERDDGLQIALELDKTRNIEADSTGRSIEKVIKTKLKDATLLEIAKGCGHIAPPSPKPEGRTLNVRTTYNEEPLAGVKVVRIGGAGKSCTTDGPAASCDLLIKDVPLNEGDTFELQASDDTYLKTVTVGQKDFERGVQIALEKRSSKKDTLLEVTVLDDRKTLTHAVKVMLNPRLAGEETYLVNESCHERRDYESPSCRTAPTDETTGIARFRYRGTLESLEVRVRNGNEWRTLSYDEESLKQNTVDVDWRCYKGGPSCDSDGTPDPKKEKIRAPRGKCGQGQEAKLRAALQALALPRQTVYDVSATVTSDGRLTDIRPASLPKIDQLKSKRIKVAPGCEPSPVSVHFKN